MLGLSSAIVFAASAIASVAALPGNYSALVPRYTGSQTGTFDGYYFSYWTDGTAQATYTNTGAGAYSLSWGGNVGNFVGGVGWNPGSTSRSVTFGGSWSTSGNAYLSLYGWSTNPLVEYYVMEDFGTYNPGSAATNKGTYSSDGSTYTMYTDTRTNAPSIIGTATFQQFISVRSSKRTSGTITFANHVNAWAGAGLHLGTMNYQIIATEGYYSSGSASLTVH
ncbi:endo-1,4-beta-xylanase [Clavulina sp. PMI_390]|nr:endo-1,4-beta-xylanase [Clavulina sp. PMI_390]